ncbi:multidrug resistance-associated ABC transporter [Pholiota conissans]|uniref:Multidrug resistance-associated ABC transporter n=1 Tax=Pholiota conissans TaxID=109636 RepID=A0A9P5YTA4_9AGAR|nr:multidrug resistance-associated ABC transporter [Pholiota conissans]
MMVVSIASARYRPLADMYNIGTLLLILGVYVYRDLYPLTRFDGHPADSDQGKLLWVKISMLCVVGAILPLFTPRRYVPIDPKHPSPIPSPEQTAPWISRITFTYMDSVIYMATKVAHLSFAQLPPLSDVDASVYQSSLAFPHLEPSHEGKYRHLFFGLLYTFRFEYLTIATTMALSCLFEFIAPIGIKKTLNYIETGGTESTVRPWVWISLLLIGPFLQSISEHMCLFLETKIRVRLQAILTQFVFEHSLRIRLKAEVSDDAAKEDPAPMSIKTIPSVESAEAESVHAETETVIAVSLEASETSAQGIKGNVKDVKLEVPGTKKGTSENLIGKINNLVTTDLENITEGLDFLSLCLRIPLQIILCLIFLYQILGWSAFVGFATTLLLSPIGGYLAKMVQDAQMAKMQLTDARVQKISEAVNVLRMIKLFGWEVKMTQLLDRARQDELKLLWKTKALIVGSMITSYAIPVSSMLTTYSTYTVIMEQQLNASIIFSSMAVFSILTDQLNRLSWQTALIIQGKVSLDRVTDFVRTAEVLDRFNIKKEDSLVSSFTDEDHSQELGFNKATFAWSAEDEGGAMTPYGRRFRLQVDDELLFKPGCINLIIGPTGSGKTSMLMALLGEMHFIPSSADSWFNLPREHGVAYASQESWVQNATIRENILFGTPYDEERYKKVIRQCALEADIKLFEAGDQTEVGERGLTLSGGQKARVTLARAIYSSAEIVLLDDVLAALDVHTSSWIVEQCFCGDLVKGRTILLVTHNVALVGPVAQFIVSIGLDGCVRSHGTDINTALRVDPILALEVEHDKETPEKNNKQPSPEAEVLEGKLVLAEELAEGHITWKSMQLLLSGFGGQHSVLFFVVIMAGIIATQLAITLQTWFLGVWATQYEIHDPSEVSLLFYLTTLTGIVSAQIGIFTITNLYYNYRAVRASRVIHAKLIESVFGSTLRWLDETPTARIIARCTQDIRTVDGPIAQSLMWVIVQIVGALMKLSVIALITPIFLLPGVAIGAIGMLIGNVYLKAQLSVKREMSNARSPMLAHFSAAMHGLVSIRAYASQQAFKDELHRRIDHYSRTARTSWNLNRWVGFRIDALGAVFTTALAAYLVYGKAATASNTGFSLNLAVSFCTNIFWLIRIFNELEVEANSLERIQAYIDIDHDPKATESDKPPAFWPTSGDLRVENLNARYSRSGPKVLHDVSFTVSSGERVGVVGRTGSGKSSLMLALLRCIPTEGTVYYDGIATNKLNLDALRSNITIIPQTPELLSGSLRQNLDPFDQYDDATLNNALRSSGLFSLQQEDAPITLDTQISGGGSNLSIGQRQIIALARAMVRGSKILILDEATSAVDYKTDSVIQRTLRTEIGRDVTVITIAHRLQTIMDADKIMVLDNGRLVEFDKPKNLLDNEEGILRALVVGSKDKSALYEMADNA